MPYNPAFDIKKPDFELDLIFGELGEDLVRTFVSNICAGNIEVKTDRYRNGRMVIETHQHRFKAECPGIAEPYWKLSGINVTEADWWVYMFSPGAFLMVPVSRLKKFLRVHRDMLGKREFAVGSNNPSRGFLLFPQHVHDLMNNPEWD